MPVLKVKKNGVWEYIGSGFGQGEDGYTPIKGVDYFTNADKKEIINAVIASITNADEVSY